MKITSLRLCPTLNDLETLTRERLHTLELCASAQVEDKPESIVSQLVLMRDLRTLKMEEVTWLSPEQVKQILGACKRMKVFHFTPQWVRKTHQWVQLKRRHGHILTGADFEAMYLKCAKNMTTAHYLEMAFRKPFGHWAGIDFSVHDIYDSDNEL